MRLVAANAFERAAVGTETDLDAAIALAQDARGLLPLDVGRHRLGHRPTNRAGRRSMNEAMPSWKSAVAITALLIAAMAAIAAGSLSSSASRALAIVCCSANG